MATELVRCQCVSGRIPDDVNSQSGQALKDCLEQLSEQEGFQRCYWGMEVENQDVFRLFVDWDSVDSHKKFMAAPQYKPFCDRLGTVLDLSKIQVLHTHYTPHPPQAALSDLSAPATEIITAYFPSSYSKSDQDTFVENFKKLIKAIEENTTTTYCGSAGGWVDEEIDIPESNGEKAKVWSALIGWTSVQDHLDFRTTQAFKDNVHYLRGAKDLKHITVVHSSNVMITRGGGVGDSVEDSAQEEILNPQEGGKQSVKTRADGTTTKNDGGATNALKKERQGR